MEKFLIAVFLVLLTKNAQGIASCSMDRQIYDVKGNISLDLGAGGADMTKVATYAQVALDRLENYTQLQIMELSLTDGKGNGYPSPNGIEKPVQIYADDSGGYRLTAEPDDSVTSIAIKRHLINLLPRQVITKTAYNPNLSQIKATQDLLKRGDHEIVLRDDYKELIVVLGNTGAGKSTLTQWIAGDSSRLEAKEVVEGEYIIEDSLNRIGNSTIDSKTTFPELIINEEYDEAYYDFPGFSDTRDSSYDIATSYFIKRTLDHAKAIKMLFVVSYPSVRKGVDRQDFLKLLRHISELIKDINKFHNSIALIVTKVDNQIVIRRGVPTLIDDGKIIAGIAKFLEEAKTDLEHRFSTSNPSSKDISFYKNSIKFIDAVLEKEHNSYTRIGIFRRPSEPGPLNEMINLEEERKRLSKMMHHTLSYTQKISDDFGRTVSDRSKNDINDLIQEVDKNILYSTCSVGESLQKYFADLQMQLSSKINTTNTNNIAMADEQLKNIIDLFHNFTNTYYFVNEMTSSIKNMKNNEDVSQLISERVTSLGLPTVDESAKEILTQGRYLKFLQSISDTESNSRISPLAWASSFQSILTEQSVTLSHTQYNIEKIESEISNRVQYEVEKIGKDLLDHFYREEENIHDLRDIIKKVRLNYKQMYQIVNIDNTADYIDIIIKITTDLKINTSEGMRLYLTRDTKFFDQLKNEINDVIEYLLNSELWYTFLDRLHKQLLTYEIQKEKTKYYEITKRISQHYDGKKVSEVGLEVILEEIFDNEYMSIYGTIQNITLDKNKIRNFGEIVSVTLKPPDQSCIDNKMVIEGTVIKLSDVLQMGCPNELSLIEIFATNKVIIDFNLTAKNVDLTLIAPTWEVQGKRYIKLVGKMGAPHMEPKAPDGIYSSDEGKDGEAGLPGYQGGNFLGIGKTFINSEYLSIYSIGGSGGPGQNGGDGARGADGENPYINDPEKYLISIGWYDDPEKYDCDSSFLWWCLSADYTKLELAGCTNGGKPGLGGTGGLGGFPGKINIIEMTNETNDVSNNIHTEKVYGDEGKAGLHGLEGRGGRPGKYVEFDWRWTSGVRSTVKDTKDCRDEEESTTFYNFTNSNNQKTPSYFPLDEANTIKEFKDFLSRNLKDTVTASDIKAFLDELKKTPGIPNSVVPTIPAVDATDYYTTEDNDVETSTIPNDEDFTSLTGSEKDIDMYTSATEIIDIRFDTNTDDNLDYTIV